MQGVEAKTRDLSRGFLFAYKKETTMPKQFDIVYVLAEEDQHEELRYSLRSVEKNFPHRKVWFVGALPEGFKPDAHIKHVQQGPSKWAKIRSSMYQVLDNPDVTDDFFWFNDDFFVMKPFEGEFVNYCDGSLERRVNELHSGEGMNAYTRTLYKAWQELMGMRCPAMNYDVHLPMLFNKELARNSINKCSSPQMRSIYGNINRIPYIIHPDVKVYDLETVSEDPDFLSTNGKNFYEGAIGEYIRKAFPKKSRFEV